MKFEFSPHIAIQVKDYAKAKDFYERVLGMEIVNVADKETHFKCGMMNFYVENNPSEKTFFEFKVESVFDARTHRESNQQILDENGFPPRDRGNDNL